MTRRRRMAIVSSLLCVPLLIVAAGHGGGFRINLTPSFPLGLWRIVPLDREVRVGDRLFVCPPDTSAFRKARTRGYLGRGLCPGWFSPMIKTVVALSGQTIEIGRSVIVDDHEVPNSTPQPADGSGRPLAPCAGGVVAPGMLFLHSSYRGSYDSRYFGPVPASGVLGLAEPVLTFEP